MIGAAPPRGNHEVQGEGTIHKLGYAWDPNALGGDRKCGNGDRLCDISGIGVVYKSSAQSGEGTGFLVPLHGI